MISEFKSECEVKNKVKNLSDQDLISNLKNLINQERSILTEILQHLLEVDNRKLFLTLGFSSLYEYVTQELHYNEAQAYRRIQAMRALREVPEIESKIDQGRLTLTQITQAQEYFRSEKKKGEALSPEEKSTILSEIAEKTTRETERYFIKLSPELGTKDKTRLLDEERVEIKFVANQKLLIKLNRFKELDSHVQNNPDYAELFERLVDLALKQKAPELKKKYNSESKEPENSDSSSKLSAQTKITNPRLIPAQVKREVIAHDHGACAYKNPTTGKICGSKYQLELDHITPVALDGQSTVENLRLLCRNHNMHEAVRIFGADKMGKYSAPPSSQHHNSST